MAFASSASDLVPGDGNGADDIFLRDVVARTTTRVSVDTGGGDPNGSSEAPSVNATGRFVAFHSFASDLVPGDGNFATDVFLRDLVAGTTTRVSVDTAGGDPNGSSFFPSISKTGRYVGFESNASDLVPGDGNGATDVSSPATWPREPPFGQAWTPGAATPTALASLPPSTPEGSS